MPTVLLDLVRRLLPIAVSIGAAALGWKYFMGQKKEDERQRDHAEQAAELGRRIRDLEREKQQLEGYVSSSLSDVLTGRAERK